MTHGHGLPKLTQSGGFRWWRASVLAVVFVIAQGIAVAAGPLIDPGRRAAEVEGKMTDAERLQLMHGLFAFKFPGVTLADVPREVPPIAGYIPGIPRLHIPALLESDGGAGVANIPETMRPGDSATAFPSMLALGASFDRDLAYAIGAAMGAETQGKGFNLLLAGGINLTRDPRGGRNNEYLGEDPLVSGYLGGDQIRGTQDQGVIGTVKHYALYSQATPDDTYFDARIDETALRESDLLAFELAIRIGRPGAVMCAYNKVNGQYACGNKWLLDTVLKHEWHYPGWVMSDWGAVHADGYLESGLDQESGAQLDDRIWFADPIRARLGTDPVIRTRVSDATRRILRSMYAVGLDKSLPPRAIDFDKDLAVAQRTASEGIVLLKNSGVLPIGTAVKSVLVVGGNAHLGVLAQGGWTTVAPVNQPAFVIPAHDVGSQDQRHVFFPPGPYQALRQRMPGVTVDFDTGYDPDVAAQRAASADVAIVFATRWQTQTQDAGNLDLPAGQDLLIEKVARANSNTVVVLETGNPVLMPWLSQVAGVLEAWYPGQRGAAAIAEILTGARNPSGHLPMTFPASDKRSYPPLLARIPHASLEEINYPEGANVGYRRMEGEVAEKPLFPFGYGLSYTQFKTGGLTLDLHQGLLRARTQIENTGARPGASVVQVYLLSALGGSTRRLVGFQRVDLMPGERRSVSIPLEPRTIARWQARGWIVAKGRYGFAICIDAENCEAVTEVALSPASLKMD